MYVSAASRTVSDAEGIRPGAAVSEEPGAGAPRRWMVRGAAAVVLALAALGASSLWDGARMVNSHVAGFLVSPNRLVLALIRPQWSLSHAARVLFAEVVAADSRPVTDAAQLHERARRLPEGTPVIYRFRKNAEFFTEIIPVRRFEVRDFLNTWGAYFGIGLCFAAAGLRALQTGGRPASASFFLLCQVIAVAFLTAADHHGPHRFTALYFGSLCLIPAALLHFAACFPEPIAASRLRGAVPATLAAGGAVLAAVLHRSVGDLSAFLPLVNTVYLLIGNALLLYIARLLIGVWSTDEGEARHRLRRALLAIVLPLLAAEICVMIAPLLGAPIAPVLVAGPLVLFPLLTASAIRSPEGLPRRRAASSVRLRLSLLFLGAVETAFLAGVSILWMNTSRERFLDDVVLNQRRQARVELFLLGTGGDQRQALESLEGMAQTAVERDLTLRAARALDAGDAGEARTTVRTLGNQYREQERRLGERRNRLRLLASAVVLALVVMGTVQAAVFLIAIRRWLIRPIDRIADATAIIATGDLEHRAESEADDEFARLAAAVNSMATSLAAIQGRIDAEQEARRRASGEASDAERRRLARELHDGILQDLGAAKLNLEALARRDPAPQLRQTVDGLVATINELRRLVDDLRPPTLSNVSLAQAIAAHAGVLTRGSDIALDLEFAADAQIPDWATRDVYRIAQEAIRNAVHHGRPRRIAVRLAREAGGHLLEVFDDGAGFDPSSSAPGGGLPGMRERADALGARLEITSAAGEGTLVRLFLPTEPPRRWPPLAT